MSWSELLARHIAFPAHEWLRGRPTLSESHACTSLLRYSPESVTTLVAARLRALLRFAARELPFYQAQFAAQGVNPDSADPFAELARLPVLTKADVRRHADAITWRAVPGGLQPAVSGGTSGDTLHFWIDRLRQAQSMGARLAMQAQFGVRSGDRRLWVWGSPIELRRSRLRAWRDWLINERVVDAFDMHPERMTAYLATILNYRPRLVMGYSSAVAMLAAHAARRHSPRDFAFLRVIVLTGDEAPPDDRARIAATFGCPVAAEYGSREVGVIAHECPRGRLHVMTPHVWVEVLQGARPAPAGATGSIICTNLNTRAQPFLRYQLGDVGRLVPTGCDCGWPLPVLEIQGGRITGFVVLPDGRLCHGHLVAYIVRADPSIVAFKVYQRTLTRFEVLVVVDPARFTPAVLGRIRDGFRAYFGRDVDVEIRVVDEIPPDPSGKRRHLVSDVAAGVAEFAVVET
jgi:phenylacetate-CoA ligase